MSARLVRFLKRFDRPGWRSRKLGYPRFGILAKISTGIRHLHIGRVGIGILVNDMEQNSHWEVRVVVSEPPSMVFPLFIHAGGDQGRIWTFKIVLMLYLLSKLAGQL